MYVGQTAMEIAAKELEELIESANTNMKSIPGPVYNVKGYGAKGDGIKNDSLAIQKTIDCAISSGGGTVFFPPGNYVLSGVVIDLSEISSSKLGINIIGSGSMDTKILVTGGGTAFSIKGSMDQDYMRQNFRFGGMRIDPNPGEGFTGTGLDIKIGAFFEFFDIYILSLDKGIITEDLVSTKFDNVRVRFCREGFYGKARNVFTRPNALDLYRCHFGNNRDFGVKIDGGVNFSMFGGSIEGNGLNGNAPQRFGIQINEPRLVGCSLYGVYFESNYGLADINIVQGTDQSVNLISGCNFMRADPNNYAPYCIRVDQQPTGGEIKLTVESCGFQGYNGYVPDSSRPYVKFFASGVHTFEEMGNFYGSPLERPEEPNGSVFARLRFNGTLSSPVPVRGYNIANITKNGTGEYVITFNTESKAVEKVVLVSINGPGYGYLMSATNSSVTIRTNNTAGALADFSAVSVVVYE